MSGGTFSISEFGRIPPTNPLGGRGTPRSGRDNPVVRFKQTATGAEQTEKEATMDLNEMSTKAGDLVDYLVDLLTNEEPATPTAVTEGLEARDLGDISESELDQAFALAMDRLPPESSARLVADTDGASASTGFGGASAVAGGVRAVAAPAPAPLPAPRVVQAPPQVQVVERIVQAPPQVKVVERITERVNTVHEQPIVHQTVVNKAGDTIIDNSVDVDITADGDVKNVEIDIKPTNTTATQGGVAAAGDIDDSAVNTGSVKGVQNAGDGQVDAEDAIIGDKNTEIEDSEIGAIAQGGDATNTDIDGENVLVGDGELNNSEVDGDGTAVAGKGNDAAGDTDIKVDDVDGPVNVAAGDANDQAAAEQDTTVVDQSQTDNSVETTDIEENVAVDTSVEDNDSFSQDDNSSFEQSEEDTNIFADVEDSDDTDIDF